MKVDNLDPQMFYQRESRLIFEAARSLFTKGKTADVITITEALREKGVPGARQLCEDYLREDNLARIDDYADEVRRKWVLRRIVEISEGAIDQALHSNPVAILESLERDLLSLKPGNAIGFQRLGFLSPAKIGPKPKIIPTGFASFDYHLGGLGSGRLLVVASRPGIGKTTLAQGMAAAAASKGARVGFYSLEMSSEELSQKFLAAEAQVEQWKIKDEKLEVKDVERLAKAVYRMGYTWELYVDDTPNLSVYEIGTRAKRQKLETGLDVLFVDYLQLITYQGKTDNRVTQVGDMTRALKLLAKELDIPIVLLSQLNRKVEYREEPQPRLADLRESGSIEQDADQVIFLWRETDFSGNSIPTKVSIAKNRHGRVWNGDLRFMVQESRFVQ